MSLSSIPRLIAVVALAFMATGCIAHRVTFQDAKYVTDARKNNAAVVAVIDQETLARKVTIHSFTTGCSAIH